MCRVHVERKLTSSAVMWARLHCSPLELSLQRLLVKQISVNLSLRWKWAAPVRGMTCVPPVSVAGVWWPRIFLHQRYNNLFSHVCQQRECGVHDEVYEPCRSSRKHINLHILDDKSQNGKVRIAEGLMRKERSAYQSETRLPACFFDHTEERRAGRAPPLYRPHKDRQQERRYFKGHPTQSWK